MSKNLADTVKIVLKTKTQYILKSFIKKDLIIILNTTSNDILGLSKIGLFSILSFRHCGIKLALRKVTDIGPDLCLIVKEIPQRVRTAFFLFKEEFITELDRAPSQKLKKTLCLKVIVALVRMTIPKDDKLLNNISLRGIKSKTALTDFIVTRFIEKLSRIFIFRLLEVVEEELSLKEDLDNVRYFKELITGDSINYSHLDKIHPLRPEEPSFQMIKNLEQFIMTGTA